MSKGVNKVILLGHLGNDPEVRYTAAGAAVATVSLATNSATKDKQTGEWRDMTEWHRVVFFDRLAEIVGQYLRKGSQVYVEGRLKTRKWQDNSGQDRYTTEIVAQEMQMVGGRSEGSTTNYAAAPSSSNYSAPSPSSPPPGMGQPTPPPSPPHQTAPTPSSTDQGYDDDVPF